MSKERLTKKQKDRWFLERQLDLFPETLQGRGTHQVKVKNEQRSQRKG